MTGFFLLLGHLVGDYIVQNDWMAKNKVVPHPGPKPQQPKEPTPGYSFIPGYWEDQIAVWQMLYNDWKMGHIACTVHCLLYTAAVWAYSYWWMPWWGLVVCFMLHWPVDRFKLASWWMHNVSRQSAFATSPLSPWSVILVDNIFHLIVLGAINLWACGVPT